jgi:uncharacterized protein (TIGR03435 family)
MNGSKTLVLVTAVAALLVAGLRAQAPVAGAANPVFEVVSIKPNKSGDGRMLIGFQPGGRFTATGITLRMLIGIAYGTPQPLPNFRIIGGPSWMNSDRYDIVAKAEGDVPPGPDSPIPLMIRSMLADRFKLAAHNESRELPIYELVKSRSDGKLGPQLHPAAVDCAALAAARGRGGVPPPGGPGDFNRGGPGRGPGGPGPGGPGFGPGGRPPCGIFMGPASLAAGSQSMAQLATMLSGRVARTVVDRTGLTGTFDMDLTWTPDQIPQGQLGPPPPGAPPLPPIDPNGPSIFTAVQEQLGLKLESTKGPVDVVVIDSVEPPTED